MKLLNLLLLLIIGTLSGHSQTSTAPPPIIEAIKAGNLSKVEQFLEDNKDINVPYAGYTLLCAAVKTNQKEIVTYLVENGADLNKMSNKKTPLMYAAKYGRLAIAQFLVQKGADKHLKSPKNKTALDYAYRYKQLKLIGFFSE